MAPQGCVCTGRQGWRQPPCHPRETRQRRCGRHTATLAPWAGRLSAVRGRFWAVGLRGFSELHAVSCPRSPEDTWGRTLVSSLGTLWREPPPGRGPFSARASRWVIKSPRRPSAFWHLRKRFPRCEFSGTEAIVAETASRNRPVRGPWPRTSGRTCVPAHVACVNTDVFILVLGPR